MKILSIAFQGDESALNSFLNDSDGKLVAVRSLEEAQSVLSDQSFELTCVGITVFNDTAIDISQIKKFSKGPFAT